MTILIEEAPVLYNTVFLAGIPTPGKAEVSGGDTKSKWDARAGVGKAGASTIFTGKDLAEEITVKLTFAEGLFNESAAQQKEYFYSTIVPILQRSEDGKTAIDFYFPPLSAPPHNISSVVTRSVGMVTEDPNGFSTVTFKLLQYVKPKPAPVTKPAASQADQVDPMDAKFQQDMAQRRAEWDAA